MLLETLKQIISDNFKFPAKLFYSQVYFIINENDELNYIIGTELILTTHIVIQLNVVNTVDSRIWKLVKKSNQ